MGITSTGSGNLPSTGDQLAVVDDADEALRGGGDDLLAGERGAAALDQRAVGGGLIGAVDIETQDRPRNSDPVPECPRRASFSEVWRELETAPASCILRSFSASMSWFTVEPVPMPSTMPLST